MGETLSGLAQTQACNCSTYLAHMWLVLDIPGPTPPPEVTPCSASCWLGPPLLGLLHSCHILVQLPFSKIVFGKEKQPIFSVAFPGTGPHFSEWQRSFHAIPNGNCDCSKKVEELSICKAFILPQSCDLFYKLQIDVCIQSLNSKAIQNNLSIIFSYMWFFIVKK